jgi:peptidyl-prolyl cis-trans isomerase D
MLDSLRNMMGGVVAKVLLGLLVISFAVWGVSGTFIGGAATNTVTVGNTKVSLAEYRLAYLNRVNALERQLNQSLTREQLRALGVEQAVLGDVVAGAVLDEAAREMGLGISDDQLADAIGQDPAFRDPAGNFSRQYLEAALRQIGMSEDQYVASRRDGAIREQLLSGLAFDVAMPQAFIDAYGDYLGQRRAFRYLVVTPELLPSPPEPSEEQLRTFFDEHKDQYRAPEYRKLVLVRLTAEDIADPASVTEEAIAAAYEDTKERFTTPEKRRIQQLPFSDRAAAEDAARRLSEGTSFDTIMAEAGRTAEDVDLGTLARSEVPDQIIAEAGFALEQGATSPVIDGIFGPVILRVTEIHESDVKPLSDVADQIREEIALDNAAEAIFDIHDRLEDERAAGDPLAQAAETVGLAVRTIDQIDRLGNGPDGSAIPDIPEAQSVLQEAFDTDIGVEADPVSIGTSGFVWYEVEDVIEERQKTFEEVREAVSQAWTEAEIARSVEEKAQEIRDRLADGGDFDSVAAELLLPGSDGNPVKSQTSVLMGRSDTSADLSAAAVTAGFSIAEGATAVARGNSDTSHIVVQLTDIAAAEDYEAPQDVRDQMDVALTNDLVSTVIGDLQSREDVAINTQAIETAITY